MSKQIRRLLFCLLLILGVGTTLDAHPLVNNDVTEVAGRVVDSGGEPLAGVNIRVKDKLIGTTTNPDGTFSLRVSQDPPLTLVFSIVGFQSVEVDVTTSTDMNIDVILEEQTIFGNDVVVSASRVEESILSSPVSIEKMDVLDIQTSASPDFYSSISNLKGVDFSTQSLTFKSINSRGFGANGNTRFVQLIDGIDNQAPGLNFAVGNIVGISELDLESAELIPGAASALYGPNALNGILLMNSKSPFDYPGISVSVKTGVNHVDSNVEDPSLYQSYGLRIAQSFNNKFAFKLTGSYLKAQDFVGQDYRDQSDILERGATSRAEAAVPRIYDGLNVYGDFAITTGIVADVAIAQGSASAAATRSVVPDGAAGAFTPTGYTETSFVDNTTESIKFGGALHYYLNDSYELVAQYNTGYGSTVYTANDRFVLDNFNIWTAKLELRNPNLFLRAYTTQEDAGDSYAANTAASLINQKYYLGDYLGAFVSARLGQQGTENQSIEQAHAFARMVADQYQSQGRPDDPNTPEDETRAPYTAGTALFDQELNNLRNTPISEGGAKFLDKSDLYHVEGLYNFSNLIDPEVAEVIAGVNFRQYALESQGTLFALQDNGDEYSINEWGAYAQFSKQFMDGNLDFSASSRYDKNEYFDGQFSPRVSAILTVADVHNFRASFQRGFRIPTTQDQFIDLDVVSRRLIGSNPDLVDRYNFETNTVYTAESVQAAQVGLATGQLTTTEAAASLEVYPFEDFKPEKINTFEIGYKSLIGDKLFLDAYYYYSAYTDFIAEVTFVQGIPNGLTNEPGAGYTVDGEDWREAIITGEDPNNPNQSFPTQAYGFDVNADGTVSSHGFAVTADYSLAGGYTIGGNVSYNELLDQDRLLEQGFRASYNTPEWRYNIKLQNRKLTDNIGFNMVYRWQDAYIWESSIGEGVVPAFGTLDAQVSYKLPDFNTIVKIGGSNILNERYTTSLANPRLGAIYYISFTFDQFLN